jgi:DNA-binding response OmpR family regulator
MARVLCIEDEFEMSQLMDMILTRDGHDVKLAATGHEGLALIEQVKPEIILLDLMMPDLDGWEVYQTLKAQPATANIPVVIVSARAQATEKAMALKVAQVDDYLVKPFNPAQLLETVARVLQQ